MNLVRTVFCGVFAIHAVLFANPVLAQRAADAFYDPEEMAAARASLHAGHGSQLNSLLIAERLEFAHADDEQAMVWEAQGWWGGDLNKLWVKTEGELESGGDEDAAELQLLFSRAISPFWDLQAGWRQASADDDSTDFFVLGAMGLAPQWFEVDAALFVSDAGEMSARLEAEYELFLTQRLILQPRVELNLALEDDVDRGLESGLFDSVAELRLRYEIRREFAPYLGVSWGGEFGGNATAAAQNGLSARQTAVVAGFRFWF